MVAGKDSDRGLFGLFVVVKQKLTVGVTNGWVQEAEDETNGLGEERSMTSSQHH